VAFKDAKEFWTNYKGYKHLGLGGPTGDYACPVHLIWFPQINETDSDVFQLRTSFFMTTSLSCRFYSKFPTNEDTAYSALEAYMGQLYISDNDTGSKLANGVSDTVVGQIEWIELNININISALIGIVVQCGLGLCGSLPASP